MYANELAKRGFVVLTFDQSFMGESAGEPRNVSSPEIFTENFSAAVDFLGTKLSYVDRERSVPLESVDQVDLRYLLHRSILELKQLQPAVCMS